MYTSHPVKQVLIPAIAMPALAAMLRWGGDAPHSKTNVPACAGRFVHYLRNETTLTELRLAALLAGIPGTVTIATDVARVVLTGLAATLLPAAALLLARLSLAVIMLCVLLATLLAALVLAALLVLITLVLVRHNTLANDIRHITQ
jgi:hypothetical protein